MCMCTYKVRGGRWTFNKMKSRLWSAVTLISLMPVFISTRCCYTWFLLVVVVLHCRISKRRLSYIHYTYKLTLIYPSKESNNNNNNNNDDDDTIRRKKICNEMKRCERERWAREVKIKQEKKQFNSHLYLLKRT